MLCVTRFSSHRQLSGSTGPAKKLMDSLRVRMSSMLCLHVALQMASIRANITGNDVDKLTLQFDVTTGNSLLSFSFS